MDGGIESAEHDVGLLEQHTTMITTVANSLIQQTTAGSTVVKNKVPRARYMDLKKTGDSLTGKLETWLGIKETPTGYKSLNNLVKRFLTMYGLLISIKDYPDYNKR